MGRCSACVLASPDWISRYALPGSERNPCQRRPPAPMPQRKSLRPRKSEVEHWNRPCPHIHGGSTVDLLRHAEEVVGGLEARAG